MSEKAVATGHYFIASGMYVVLGHPLYVEGSENVTKLLCKDMESTTRGRFEWEPDKLIASSAIRGAHAIVRQAEEIVARAVAAKGGRCAAGFPDTAYSLCIRCSSIP